MFRLKRIRQSFSVSGKQNCPSSISHNSSKHFSSSFFLPANVQSLARNSSSAGYFNGRSSSSRPAIPFSLISTPLPSVRFHCRNNGIFVRYCQRSIIWSILFHTQTTSPLRLLHNIGTIFSWKYCSAISNSAVWYTITNISCHTSNGRMQTLNLFSFCRLLFSKWTASALFFSKSSPNHKINIPQESSTVNP